METRKVNPYRRLLHPGIVGQVNTREFETISLINIQAAGVQIRVGELLQDVWDYGFFVKTDEMAAPKEKYPGEGEGWFASRQDAMLYGLASLRAMPELTKWREIIEVHLNETANRSLFD